MKNHKKNWKKQIMKWTKSDLAERLMLAYVTIQNLEEEQERQTAILSDIRRHVSECTDGVGRFIHERMLGFEHLPKSLFYKPKTIPSEAAGEGEGE